MQTSSKVGFIRRYLLASSEIDHLEGELSKEQWRNGKLADRILVLEKQTLKQQADFYKATVFYADNISRKNGLYGSLQEIIDPPKEQAKPSLDLTSPDDARIYELAKTMKEGDDERDANNNWTLDMYVEKIREDGEGAYRLN